MDPKTKELVEATERLASAASGLPYEVCAASDGACSCGLIHSIPADMPVCQAYAQDEDAGAHFTHEQRVANARFIAHACTSSVALCAIIREQDEEIERLRAMLEDVGIVLTDASERPVAGMSGETVFVAGVAEVGAAPLRKILFG